MTTRKFAGLMTLLLASLAAVWPLVAQQDRPRARKAATPKATKLAPGDIDLASSGVYVFVGKTGLGHEHAVAGRIKAGAIHLGAAENAGKIVFDMQSFVADTPEARKYIGLEGETDPSTAEQVTTNMLGAQVLDAAKHPTAEFAIDSCQLLKGASKRGFPRYQLDGTFALHGVQKPIRVVAELDAEQEGRAHLRGAFKILQTDYGIKPFSKALGAVGVANELTIWGDFWLAREAAVSARGTNRK